jgi:hypothetical protein
MILRGILKAFSGGSFTADVQLDGSVVSYLTGVPVNRALASGDMVAGRKVAVWLGSGNNPQDAVVIAVWT